MREKEEVPVNGECRSEGTFHSVVEAPWNPSTLGFTKQATNPTCLEGDYIVVTGREEAQVMMQHLVPYVKGLWVLTVFSVFLWV